MCSSIAAIPSRPAPPSAARSKSLGRAAACCFLPKARAAAPASCCRSRRALSELPLTSSCRCCRSLWRSEEHTSELQSRGHLVCRLLLEKKKYKPSSVPNYDITRCSYLDPHVT